MSKITSGFVLISMLMALSLGVAFAEDEVAEEEVTEMAANDTNVTNATNMTNETNASEVIEVVEVAEEEPAEEEAE